MKLKDDVGNSPAWRARRSGTPDRRVRFSVCLQELAAGRLFFAPEGTSVLKDLGAVSENRLFGTLLRETRRKARLLRNGPRRFGRRRQA